MKKSPCFLLLALLISVTSPGQKQDRKLQMKLEEVVKDFRGDVGVYARHLKTGHSAGINIDTLFPTASMIKIPITIGVFDKIENGELNYRSEMVYKDSLLYAGVDLLGSFKDGEKIALDKLLMLMLTMSDNTASLWCQHLAGTGIAINEWLADNGFAKTRVNSRTSGRAAIWEKYGWGHSTPREMAELVARIRDGKVISPRVSERIYRDLTRSYWDTEGLSQIPPYIQAASKQGSVDDSRSEVILVNAPHGDYVFCVITKNQQDQTWQKDNEGYVLLRKISRLLWEHYEPADNWKPAEALEEWY
jgi:beta-lactamase class A